MKIRAIFTQYADNVRIFISSRDDAQYLWQLGGFGKCPEHSLIHTLQSKSQECLITTLSIEEALYLMKYHSDIFSVYSKSNELLDLMYICNCIDFNGPYSHFRFSTYSFFRQSGWIVKSGLKYGVDFLLYKDLPGIIHSDFAILFVAPMLSWLSLIATCRTVEQVKKKLILVTKNDNSEAIDKSESKKIRIQRWDPQQTRQKLQLE